jgi:hypothetical protein
MLRVYQLHCSQLFPKLIMMFRSPAAPGCLPVPVKARVCAATCMRGDRHRVLQAPHRMTLNNLKLRPTRSRHQFKLALATVAVAVVAAPPPRGGPVLVVALSRSACHWHGACHWHWKSAVSTPNLKLRSRSRRRCRPPPPQAGLSGLPMLLKLTQSPVSVGGPSGCHCGHWQCQCHSACQ